MRTQPQDITARLEADNSKLAKQAILHEAIQEELTEFFEGVRMALDPLYTFGVKQVPTKEDNDGQGLTWSVFVDLAEKLNARELTGHAARDAILLTMAVATQEQWNGFYRRILVKDLSCGMSEKTVNKVCKEAKREDLGVPVFTCQLAHDAEDHPKKVKGKKMIDIKLDGVRVLTIVNPDGTVEQFSRNGKQFTNFPTICNQFELAAKHLSEPMVFDGEVMSGSFQDLMTQVHRKSNVNTTDAVLHLFDMIPLKDFLKGEYHKPQLERHKDLEEFYQRYEINMLLANVHVVGYELVDLDTDAGRQRFEELNQKALDGGYEGIMLKDPDDIYKCKRSHGWLKQKPYIEVTLKIVDAEEGTKKNVGKLGAFVMEGEDSGKQIRVNVGGGYSDKQRQEYWDFKDQCMDQLAEVRADAITQNRDGTYSLRFPRFRHFRGFEPGEKL
jgi:DNA ligase-1